MARYNPRRAKINRSYLITELADLFDVHKQTVKNWISDGMHVCVPTRPMLIRGADVRVFLESKRTKNKKQCCVGQIYCVACKQPQYPKNKFAILKTQNALVGDLIGECPCCGRSIYRKVSLSKISAWKAILMLTEMQGG